jgi:hypothetical protein
MYPPPLVNVEHAVRDIEAVMRCEVSENKGGVRKELVQVVADA